MKKCLVLSTLAILALSCSDYAGPDNVPTEPYSPEISLQSVAKMLSELPLGREQLNEVYDAAVASASNGYDEEYLMKDVFEAPGCGVGDDAQTRAAAIKSYSCPLRDLITEYLQNNRSGGSKAGIGNAEDYIRALTESGYQLYFPYSDQWDGKSFPIITFDPGYGAESNYGYEIKLTEDGIRVVDSVYVDENVAMTRPVWVVNNNDDSAFTPLDLYVKSRSGLPETKSGTRKLMLTSFKMLRQYDSWFGRAGEFQFKIGGVEGFKASTEAELKLYSPSVTDFMIVIKRRDKGKNVPVNAIMMTDFTNQMDKIAFLVTEDDGGTVTSWKCAATVKVESKSYGFDLDLPYRDKDDIVWRGQLTADYLREEDVVSGRFGDVEISFALE